MLATIQSRLWSPEPSVFPSFVKKSKNENIQDYNFPVVLYGCETWSLTLRQEHRLRVFENKVLRRIFGSKRDEVTGGWRNCITRSFVIYTLRQVYLE
jgi:hypothetical protein